MIKTTIVGFGDSLTRGYGVNPSVCHVERLSKYMPHYYPSILWNIVNSGVDGDTTREALKRIQYDVLDYNPNLVFILFGSNDSAMIDNQFCTQYEFENNLTEIVNKIRNHNNRTGLNNCVPIPILISPPPINDEEAMPFNSDNRIKQYGQTVKKVAQKLCCPFIDFYTYLMEETNDNFNEALQNDGIHLSEKGYDLLYDCIFSEITRLVNYDGILKDYEIK